MILVNGTSFGDRRVAGVQRYARELTARLILEEDVTVVVPAPVERLPSGRQLVRRPGALSRRLGAWSWIHRELASAAAGHVLWSPTNRAPLGVAQHVPTVHDLSVLDHPEWFRRSFAQLHRVHMPRLVRGACRVITDSEFSRGRILDRFSVTEDRVLVVHPGVGDPFTPRDDAAVANVRARYALPERYVLTVGMIEPRKNLSRLFEAWRRVPADLATGTELIVAGEPGRVFAEPAPAPDEIPTGVRLIGRVPDDDLPALYTGAAVFAYPSLYEGFGFPPLEAMACGTPVVSSSVTATAEVLGDAALLVNPRDVDDISVAIASVLTDDHLARRLRRDGIQRAALYPWDEAATKVLGVLRAAAP